VVNGNKDEEERGEIKHGRREKRRGGEMRRREER
jgi:hypothetical protein